MIRFTKFVAMLVSAVSIAFSLPQSYAATPLNCSDATVMATLDAVETALGTGNIAAIDAFFDPDYLDGGRTRADALNEIHLLISSTSARSLSFSDVICSLNGDGTMKVRMFATESVTAAGVTTNNSNFDNWRLKSVNGAWRNYGNQLDYRIFHGTGHSSADPTHPWMNIMIEDPQSKIQSAVLSGGPGLLTGNLVSYPMASGGLRWESFNDASNTSSNTFDYSAFPSLPVTYTLTITHTDSSVITKSITYGGLNQNFVSNLAFQGGFSGNAPPTFSWTAPPGGNYTYVLELYGLPRNGAFYWRPDEQGSKTSAVYSGSGTVPACSAYTVFAEDIYGNQSSVGALLSHPRPWRACTPLGMIAIPPKPSVNPSTIVYSNSVTVPSIGTADISITCPAGDTDCGYSINGGAYTQAPGTVATGDVVTARLTSAGSPKTARSANVTIAGVSLAFIVTTADAPSPFSFVAQANVAGNTPIVSNTITVSGLAGPSPISITQCDSVQCNYAVNGGSWGNAPGFVVNGDTVRVRVTSAVAFATEARLILNIGGVSDTFGVSTGAAPGTLLFSAPVYSMNVGGASVTLTVTRTGGSAGAASVSYATVNGSAAAGVNYTAKSGTLSWAAGDAAAKTITVPLLNPVSSGANKDFSVILLNPVGAILATPNPATVTLIDKSSTVQFNPSAVTVNEGSNAVLTITRAGGTVGAVTVNYATANGTAVAGSDYLATSGTLSWADGDGADKTITVPIINDQLIEPAETFTVTLSNAMGAILGAAKTATVTISDNEGANTVQFNPASLTVNEGAGTATLTVTRTGSTVGAVSATWSTADGTAKAGLDYTASSGTLNWAAGDGSAKTITIPIIDDSLVEPSETFTVNLTSAVGATLGTAKSATVSITDNESGAGTLQFAVDSYTVKENGTSVTLSVNRTGGNSGAASVQYATGGGTATAGQDYVAKSGTLTWTAGDAASKTIVVTITNDTQAEPTETFNVTLSNAVGAALGGTNMVATVSIIDDDSAAAGGIQFEARKYTVAENDGSVVLSVTRSGDTSSAAQVNYATSSGTAVAPGDYIAQIGSLSWAAGDGTARSIIVPIVNDAIAEITKSFNVTLSNAAGSALGPIPVATVAILDDDEIFPPGGKVPAALTKPNGADAGWFVDYSQHQAGVASLRSGSIGDNQKAQGEVAANFQNGMVSFALKTSSQAGADYLRFYIDGVKKGEWSGIQSTWTTVSYPLEAGPHTLRWSYEKNTSLIGGADAAWVDTVTLPALQ